MSCPYKGGSAVRGSLGVCAVRLRSEVIFLPIRSVEPDLRDADGPFGAGCHFDPYGLASQRGSCRMNDIEPVGLCLVRIRDIELHRAPHTLREAGDAPRFGQLHLPAAYPEYRYGGEFHRRSNEISIRGVRSSIRETHFWICPRPSAGRLAVAYRLPEGCLRPPNWPVPRRPGRLIVSSVRSAALCSPRLGIHMRMLWLSPRLHQA